MLKIIFYLLVFGGFFIFTIPQVDGARVCDSVNLNEWIMKSAEPRVCERVNYWVHYECGRVEGLYLTDPRCQPPPNFPTERLATSGSFIDVSLDKDIYKMGDMIHVSGTAYTSVGLPDEQLGIKILDSNGKKIIERQYKVDQFGKFGFDIITDSSISINAEDNYELHLVNYGKYGSSAFKKFTVSHDGLPIVIADPVPTPQNTPNIIQTPQNTQPVPKEQPFTNWTMVVGIVIVIAVTAVMIYKKFIESGVSIPTGYSREPREEFEDNQHNQTNDVNDPLQPTYDDLRNNFSRYDPDMLEKLIVKLFKVQGYTATQQGKVTQSDGGIDVKAERDGIEIFIQVKHYGGSGNSVGARDVRDFFGAITNVAHQGIFITTSDFTKDAITFAEEPSRKKSIVLWNGDRLQNEVRTHLIEGDYQTIDESQSIESNYYEILGAQRTDTQEEIKRKYRELSLRLHPDKAKSSLSENNMRLINQAYETLNDPEKRMQYDSELDSA